MTIDWNKLMGGAEEEKGPSPEQINEGMAAILAIYRGLIAAGATEREARSIFLAMMSASNDGE